MKEHLPLGHSSLMIMIMSTRKLGWLYIFNSLTMIYDLWLSIKNGPHKPTKIENDIMIP
jgi:hypothetical protein